MGSITVHHRSLGFLRPGDALDRACLIEADDRFMS